MMFEIIKSNTRFDFVGKFSIAQVISGLLVVASLYLAVFQTQYGVDFRGGAEVQVKFGQSVSASEVRSTLKKAGLKGVSVQTIGEVGTSEYLVKVQASEKNLNIVSQNVEKALGSMTGKQAEIRKVDIVGPKAGAQLRLSGLQAMGWALLVIMIYIGLRFDFKYSPGAIFALFHDVIIILGIFALLKIDFTLQIVAALLAVIGYSVNDTVIVYDRVREHEQKDSSKGIREHINLAINETLPRTILTSGTTLFISLAMLFLGGGAIRDFFLAISLGVFIGTYSSIFVAAPVTLFFDKFKAKSA